MGYIDFECNRYSLFEGSLSRLYSRYSSIDFFIVSAFKDFKDEEFKDYTDNKSEQEKEMDKYNKIISIQVENTEKLKDDIRDKGLGFVELIGNYTMAESKYSLDVKKLSQKINSIVNTVIVEDKLGVDGVDDAFDNRLKRARKVFSDYNRKGISFELSYLVPRENTNMSSEEFFKFGFSLGRKYGQQSILAHDSKTGKAELRFMDGVVKPIDLGDLHFNKGNSDYSTLSKGTSHFIVSSVVTVSAFEKEVEKLGKLRDKRGLFLVTNDEYSVGDKITGSKLLEKSYRNALRKAHSENKRYVVSFDRIKNSSFKYEGYRRARSGFESLAMRRTGYLVVGDK